MNYRFRLSCRAAWFVSVVLFTSTTAASASPGAETKSIEVLTYEASTLWSSMSDVEVLGNYAYCAMGYGLMIVDISSSSSPVIVSRVYLPIGNGQAVAVAGNFAHVADYNAGLQIIDITDPINPSRAGNTTNIGSAWDVAVSGTYAYVAGGSSGLQVVDISDPHHPSLVAGYPAPPGDIAAGIAVSGNHAYLTLDYAGLNIFDISNPHAPVLLGSLAPHGFPGDIAVVGNYAYLACASYGLKIVDVSNPHVPTLAGALPIGGATAGVAVEGDYAYVVDQNLALQVVDIRNPLLIHA